MKRKCDKCDRPATNHLVEINNGQKVEKHLCDLHAAEEGLAIKPIHTPIKELLSSVAKASTGATLQTNEILCGNCGISYARFREKSLLGCPDCYTAFEKQLVPLLERAHEGGCMHVGKVPQRSGNHHQRTLQISRLRKRLEQAVEAEDYELAARLRDEIRRVNEEGAET